MKHEHSIMLINRKATVAQCKMERIMLDTSLHNRKRNIWIRQQTGVNDIINTIQTGKHSWATGHIASRQYRWASRVTEWTLDAMENTRTCTSPFR